MITLQNKLYESLLDDEEDLVNNDEETIQKIFYDECKLFDSEHNDKFIEKHCKLENNIINIDELIHISTKGRTPSEYSEYIFRGFSVSPNIEYIYWINEDESDSYWKFDPRKHSISKINKFPMYIKRIFTFWLCKYNLLDYCPNIKIDEIERLYIQMDNQSNLNDLNFDFFKCVKRINIVEIFPRYGFGNFNEIEPGHIRNINANSIRIDLKLIDNSAINKQTINKEKFNKFIDELYKYNTFNELYISSRRNRSSHNMKYKVEKTKRGYSLVLIKK